MHRTTQGRALLQALNENMLQYIYEMKLERNMKKNWKQVILVSKLVSESDM